MQLREYVQECARQLKELENSDFEAKQLVCGLLQVSMPELLTSQRELSGQEQERVFWAVKRRLSGYPLQYLLGEWEFFGLPFQVGEGVLIPRQDTETLCELMLERLRGKTSQKIIDLCSGSGCIAIVLEKHMNSRVLALEKSSLAIDFLRKNKTLNQSRIEILQDDVLCPQTVETDFDCIVSNPPYLSHEDMTHLQREVSFEPEMALLAEQNGLYFYEEITRIWKMRLKVGGVLCFEVGCGQAEQVRQILLKNDFDDIQVACDLCGIERVVFGCKKNRTNV